MTMCVVTCFVPYEVQYLEHLQVHNQYAYHLHETTKHVVRRFYDENVLGMLGRRLFISGQFLYLLHHHFIRKITEPLKQFPIPNFESSLK